MLSKMFILARLMGTGGSLLRRPASPSPWAVMLRSLLPLMMGGPRDYDGISFLCGKGEERDLADVVKSPNRLTLSSSKGQMLWVGLT